jgi:hypothetical protein
MKCTRNAILVVAYILLSFATTNAIDVPNTMSYQGRLLDELGNPVDDMPMMTFAIYHDQSSGSPFWQETHQSVMVQNGIFSVILGSQGNPIPDSAFASTECWLEISVNDETLLPRTLLTATPFTFAASTVKGDMETAPGKLTITDASKGGGYMELYSASYGNDLLIINGSPSDQGRFGLYDYSPESPMMEMRADGNTRDFSIYTGEPGDEGHISFFDMSGGGPDTCLQLSFSPSSGARIRMGEPIDDGSNDLEMRTIPSIGATFRMGEPIDDGSNGLEMRTFLSGEASIQMGEGDLHPLCEINSAPTSGATIRMFNPQPEPPGELSMELTNEGLMFSGDNRMVQFTDPSDSRSLVEISSSTSSGASILMFNPQPEPPGDAVMELYRQALSFKNDCSGKLSLRTSYAKCGMAVDDTSGETLMVAYDQGIFFKASLGKADYDAYLTPTGFKLAEGAVAGHVMTSDANGIGSWQPVGASSSCGVSQGVDSSDDDTLYSSSTKTIMSQSIDCPADGYVLAMASCDGTIKHFSGSPRFIFGITDTEGSLPSDQRKEWWVDFASGVTGPISEVISVQKIFPVTAGANTFYFSGYRSLSSFTSDSCYIDNKTFSLVYIPYSYGTVETATYGRDEADYDEAMPSEFHETDPAVTTGDLVSTASSTDIERIRQLEGIVQELSRRIEQLESQ